MQLSIDVFNDVVRYLDSHQEKLRIKKLIFCICKEYWENDPNILNNVAMEDLVNELVQLKPNKEQLTFSVYQSVKTLNRPKVYAGVATVIIKQISKLYSDIAADQDTESLPGEAEVNPSLAAVNNPVNKEEDNLLRQVIIGLENHRETARIKKLMFAACKNRWENDQAVINENINKKDLYLALADIILAQLEPLYDTDNDDKKQDNGSESQILKPPTVHLNNDCDSSDPVSLDNNPSNSPQIPAYDPFEIRLEIFQYANPLRVKILIFSLLFHPWDQSDQDWSTLRRYTLEDLLQQLIQSGKSLKDIERQLYNIAQTQMDADANVQTAGILVQALQRIL